MVYSLLDSRKGGSPPRALRARGRTNLMSGRDRYKRLSEQAEEGKFSLVMPLDKMIVEKLPLEGTLFGGLYPLGETALNLRKKHFRELTPDQISARLRSLQEQGLVASSPSVGTGGTLIWQRTKRGEDVLLDASETPTNGGSDD